MTNNGFLRIYNYMCHQLFWGWVMGTYMSGIYQQHLNVAAVMSYAWQWLRVILVLIVILSYNISQSIFCIPCLSYGMCRVSLICQKHLRLSKTCLQPCPVSHVEFKKVPCVSIGCLCQPFVKNVSVCRKRASSHISCAVKLKSPCLSIRCLCVSAIYLSGLGICRAFGPWAWTPSARRACLRSGVFGQNTRRAGPLARTNIWGLQKILLLTNGNVPSSSPLDVWFVKGVSDGDRHMAWGLEERGYVCHSVMCHAFVRNVWKCRQH